MIVFFFTFVPLINSPKFSEHSIFLDPIPPSRLQLFITTYILHIFLISIICSKPIKDRDSLHFYYLLKHPTLYLSYDHGNWFYPFTYLPYRWNPTFPTTGTLPYSPMEPYLLYQYNPTFPPSGTTVPMSGTLLSLSVELYLPYQ